MTALTYNNNGFRHSFAEEEETSQPIRRRFHNADMYNLGGQNNDGPPARSTRLAKIGGHAAAKDEVVKPTKTRCRKRKQVKRACSNCRKAHSACGKQRPCPRCVLRKEEHKCVDTPRKKRIIDGEEEEDEDAEIENEHNTVSTPPPSSDDDSTSSSVGTSEHSSPIDTGFVVAAPTAVKQTRRNYYKRRRPLPKFNPQNVFKQEQDSSYRPTTTTRSSLLGSPQIKREVHSTKYAPMDTFQQQLDVKLPLTDTTFLQQQQQPLSGYYPTYYSQQVLQQQQQPQQQQLPLPAFFFQDELLDQQPLLPSTTATAYPPQQYEQQQQQQPQQQQVPYSFSFTPLTTFTDVAYGHNATLQPSVDDVDFYNNMNNNINNNVNLGGWDCSTTGFDDFSSDPDGNSLEREVEQMLGCSSDPTGRASLAASLPLQDYPWL